MRLTRLWLLFLCVGITAGCQGQSQVKDAPDGTEQETIAAAPKTSFKKAVDSADRLNTLAEQHNQAIEEQAGE